MEYEGNSQEEKDAESSTPTQSSPGLSRVFSAPGAFRSSVVNDRIAHSRGSPSEDRLWRSSTEAASPNIKQRRTTSITNPLENLNERPEKRLRLDPKPDTVENTNRDRESFSNAARGGNFSSPNMPREHSRFRQQQAQAQCENCTGTDTIMTEIIQELYVQRNARTPTESNASTVTLQVLQDELSSDGLRKSLEWILQEIRSQSEQMQRVSSGTTKPGLPSLTEFIPSPVDSSGQSSRITQLPPIPGSAKEARRPDNLSDAEQHEDYPRRNSESSQRYSQFSQEQSLHPIESTSEMSRSISHDNSSPLASNTSNLPSRLMLGSIPAHSQGLSFSRTLPSPTQSQHSSLGQQQFSPTSTHSAQNAHLQDLQHQISTKTLALQTLQREHEQLLSAFSRSQTRCSTLEKKSHVSDHEINSLTEEKVRLQEQVESLESQVENLMQSRDEAQRQSSADGAQWRQIMAMSSQLQIKGAEETRKYKADRESWDQERQTLQQYIDRLESGRVATKTHTAPPTSDGPDISDSDSLDALKQEIVMLRERCSVMQNALQEMSAESMKVDVAISSMAKIRQRFVNVAWRSQHEEAEGSE